MALTVISVAVVLSPLLLYPLPSHVFNGDVALHYKLTGLIRDDIGFVAYENYPKFFQLMNLVPMMIFGLPAGAAMYLFTAIAVAVLPYLTARVALELTGDRRLSLLAGLFSVITIFYNSQFVGAAPVPQTLALTLVPAIFYLFLKRRWLPAGLLFGVHIMLHGSWPVPLFFVAVYALLKYARTKSTVRLKDAVLMATAGGLLALPLRLYIMTNLFHDTIISGVENSLVYVTSMISLLWFPLLISPFVMVLLGLAACGRLYRTRELHKVPYLFLVVAFVLVLVSTQLFFPDIQGTVLGLTFIPSRNIPFLLLPLSILSAYVVSTAVRKNHLLILVAVALMLLSLPSYVSWYARTPTVLDASDLSTIEFLNMQDFGPVFYNPINVNSNDYFVIELGLQERHDAITGFLLLSGARNDLLQQYSYILEDKGDPLAAGIVEQNRESLSLVYSNEKHHVYAVDRTGPPAAPYSLDDHVTAFATFLRAHPKGAQIFASPTTIAFQTDSERSCLIIDAGISTGDCRAADLQIAGDRAHLSELLRTYSITEFLFRMNWFYSGGDLQIDIAVGALIRVNAPALINRAPVDAVTIADHDVVVVLDKEQSKVIISQGAEPQGFATNSLFVSRTFRWVLLNSKHTFPNVLPGVVYAGIKEIL